MDDNDSVACSELAAGAVGYVEIREQIPSTPTIRAGLKTVATQQSLEEESLYPLVALMAGARDWIGFGEAYGEFFQQMCNSFAPLSDDPAEGLDCSAFGNASAHVLDMAKMGVSKEEALTTYAALLDIADPKLANAMSITIEGAYIWQGHPDGFSSMVSYLCAGSAAITSDDLQ